MIHFRGIASQIIMLLLVTGAPAAVAVPRKPPVQQTAVPQMSICQARRAVLTELQRVAAYHWNSPPSSITFSMGELEFQAKPPRYNDIFPEGTYRVDLKTLGEVTVEHQHSFVSQLYVDGRDPLAPHGFSSGKEVKQHLSNISILGFLVWITADRVHHDDNAAQTFANAMNALRLYARTFDSSRGLPPVCYANNEEQVRIWAEFQKRAATWRALPARPPLFDAVRKQQLLAEDAVNQKQFEAAAAAYDTGTQIDPMWPEGHFNAAAIYGELKDYDDAVWHMRCYLELMPNASDAKAARDQMLLWQAKAEQQTAQ